MDSWAYWFSYSTWRWDYICTIFCLVDASNLAKMKDIQGDVCWNAITKQKFQKHGCHIKTVKSFQSDHFTIWWKQRSKNTKTLILIFTNVAPLVLSAGQFQPPVKLRATRPPQHRPAHVSGDENMKTRHEIVDDGLHLRHPNGPACSKFWNGSLHKTAPCASLRARLGTALLNRSSGPTPPSKLEQSGPNSFMYNRYAFVPAVTYMDL
jgi:hypothetical protein